MAILEILEFPDPRLRTVAKPVTEVNDRVRKLIDDMFETMYDAPGVGLAASQINVHERIVVIDYGNHAAAIHSLEPVDDIVIREWQIGG